MASILRLDGATYISVANLKQQVSADGRYTWQCSLDDLNNADIFGDTRFWVRWRGAPDNDWYVRIGNNNTFVSPYTPSIGETLNCELTWDGSGGSGGQFTVNGNSAAVGVNGSIPTLFFRLGGVNGLSDPMRGVLSNFVWYDTDQSTPLHTWPIDEGSGTVITDTVGIRDGTIVGNANWETLSAGAGFIDINDLSGVWLPGESGVPPGGAPATYQRSFAYGRGGIR